MPGQQEIAKLDKQLREITKKLETHYEAAISNGVLGEDDPVSRAFSKRIQKLRISVAEIQAKDCEGSKPPVAQPSSLSTYWSYISRMTGFGSEEDVSEAEIEFRAQSFRNAQVLFKQLKNTTKNAENYSILSNTLPRDSRRLALLDDGSAVKLLRDMNQMIPPDGVKAIHMKHSFANSPGFIRTDILQSAFDSIEKELKFISGFRQIKGDVKLQGILESTTKIARLFVIILNRYSEGRLGHELAEFATDRFKAIHTLVRNVSSLLQNIFKLERPIGDILTNVDLTPVSTILCQNNPVLIARKFEEQRRFVRELHRQKTLHDSCVKVERLVYECQEFINGTKILMRNALSIPMEIAGSADTRGICDDKSCVAEVVLRSMPSLKGLFTDHEDPNFLKMTQFTVSQGKSPSASDAVAKLKDLNLFEWKNSNRGADFQWHDQGSFGEVYKVPFEDSKLLVAVKCFKVKTYEHKAYKQIVREAIIMSDLDHKNILRVHGFRECPSESAQMIDVSLVCAFYPNGNLRDYISKNSLSELNKTKILRDIASAIEYLHNPKQKVGTVIHGDLRAMNVLIGPELRPLLCDFGLSVSSDMDETWETEANRTHVAWLAYEFFDPTKRGGKKKIPLTVKTDVYAFGCVCYEVLCEATPYQEFEMDQIPIQKYLNVSPNLDSFPRSYRLEHGHRQLMSRCWHREPSRRPSAAQLVLYLGEFVSMLSTTHS